MSQVLKMKLKNIKEYPILRVKRQSIIQEHTKWIGLVKFVTI